MGLFRSGHVLLPLVSTLAHFPFPGEDKIGTSGAVVGNCDLISFCIIQNYLWNLSDFFGIFRNFLRSAFSFSWWFLDLLDLGCCGNIKLVFGFDLTHMYLYVFLVTVTYEMCITFKLTV